MPSCACAVACQDDPVLLMCNLGTCKLGDSTLGGHTAVLALIQFCSREIPCHADRVAYFGRALKDNSSRLFYIMRDVQTTFKLPGELVVVRTEHCLL